MSISSSDVSVGNKYLDFGGVLLSALNPKDVGCAWYNSTASRAENWQKHRKPVSPISSFPAANEEEKNF